MEIGRSAGNIPGRGVGGMYVIAWNKARAYESAAKVHGTSSLRANGACQIVCLKDNKMDINEAISGRRSTRAYAPTAVDGQTLQRVIKAATLAPSAVNEQPWTFTVVRSQALLDQISQDAKTHMLATMPPGAHSDHFHSMLSDASFHIFYHAPVLVLISASAYGPWIVEDCSLAAENLMLSAFADGLGSCWIGFAQGFLNTAQGKSVLGLPAAWIPVAPIILGHAAEPPPPVQRKAPEIHWVD